ncbi:hypothetical protein E5163_05315 [Marinicauda algicola]|uniref:Uncharacterized protein n=1 Tax=Marinicauda algicola TaxID=2029849 RepID=A0A4S2H540_9PROT|nr:hypothetical protein [Marinicauda algicola]TGY90541.1 hypothetical protein E5163_05315 [Marinicauda algicola]
MRIWLAGMSGLAGTVLAGCLNAPGDGDGYYLGLVSVTRDRIHTDRAPIDVRETHVLGAWLEPARGSGVGFRHARLLVIPDTCSLVVIAEDARIAADILDLAEKADINGDRLCVTG